MIFNSLDYFQEVEFVEMGGILDYREELVKQLKEDMVGVKYDIIYKFKIIIVLFKIFEVLQINKIIIEFSSKFLFKKKLVIFFYKDNYYLFRLKRSQIYM